MADDTPESERTFVMEREFDAPARALFEAYSRPEMIKRWFGPVGWPVTLAEIDFRVGGRWRFAMTGPSGVQNTPFGGRYLEIEPDRRIVFDNTFEADGAETMVMHVTLEPLGERRTRLTLRTVFGSTAMMRSHLEQGFEAGTSSAYDQLADLTAS